MLRTMRLAPFALACLALPVLALAPACKRREDAPPPPPPAAPASIWQDADSHEVARQLVEAAAAHPWSSQFRDRNSRAATIAVGIIEDRSGQSLPIDGLSAAIAAALASSGGDKLAAGGEGSDFILRGAIGSSAGTTAEGAAATFFAIDLAVVDRASGETTWHFAVERQIAGR